MTKKPHDGKGGVSVHSKANGHGFADEDWNSFDKRVDEAIEELKKAEKKKKKQLQ